MNTLHTFCLLAVAALGTDLALAGDAGCGKPACCRQQPCQSSCKLLVCRPEVKTISLSKTCFNVECDRVCIPAVTFPWQKTSSCGSCGESGCPGESFTPRCGRVISVRVLKTEKYDVEKCVCEWNVEEVPCVTNCSKPDCCRAEAPCAPTIRPGENETAPAPVPAPAESDARPPLFDIH